MKGIIVFTSVLATYLFFSLFGFGGLMAYVIPSICWALVALITIYVSGLRKIRLWLSKPVTEMAALIAAFQIVVLVFTGFFTGFGNNPLGFTPTAVTINVAYFVSPLLALEFSRAYLVKSYPKRNVILGIGLIALFYTFVSLPLARFTSLGEPAGTAKFVGSDLLPTLAQSLLATYVALLGGPTASIAYLGTLQAFKWLSPILPNPTWAIEALIATSVPAIGFLAMNQTVTPFGLTRLGLMKKSEATSRTRRAKKSSLSLMAMAVIAVILVWSSTGLLGFRTTIIASGSMTPTLNVGDVGFLISVPSSTLKVGDIIQYNTADAPVMHRVINIYTEGGTLWLITKGDSNNAPDSPVNEGQVMGKLVFTIPQIGWASIALKEFAAETYSFLTATIPKALTTVVAWMAANTVYVTSALTVTAYLYLLITYKNQGKRRRPE
jgi:signal peptidase